MCLKLNKLDSCHLMCPAVTPPPLSSAPPPTLSFSGCDDWEWTLCVCEWFLKKPSCPRLCASVWELFKVLVHELWPLTSALVALEPYCLPHSRCFIYGPLHFWLWWLQYLSSYLNCIFKDFYTIFTCNTIWNSSFSFFWQPFLNSFI